MGCRAKEDDPVSKPRPDTAAPVPTTPTVDAFARGPVVGDVTAEGAIVQVDAPAAVVDVVLSVDGGDVARLTGLAPVDSRLQVEVTGLAPGTDYQIAAASTDDRQRSAPTRFRTPPPERSTAAITFGATSCLGQHGRPWPTLQHAAGMDLDFILLLGDSIYTQATTLDGYRREWQTLHAAPSFAALTASTSVVALWDDHEVANNWRLGRGVSEAQLAAASQAFHEGLPQRPGLSLGAGYRQLVWGDHLELFVLDVRSERSGRQIVSDAQLAWIVSALRASRAQFKVVCSSVHTADHRFGFDDSELYERWQGYPTQRPALIDAIAESGAVVLTGDMHYGGVQYLAPPDEPGSTSVEVCCGPGGSRPNEDWRLIPESPQYPLFVEGNTVSRFVADPAAGTLTVAFVDGSGTEVANRRLV